MNTEAAREILDSLGGRLELESLTTLHWIGVYMALITAIVHLVFGIGYFPYLVGNTFLLAAGGFLGGIVLLLIDYRRRLLYLVGIPYTGVQIVAWWIINGPNGPGLIGPADIIDKIAQVTLILVLITLYRWDW